MAERLKLANPVLWALLAPLALLALGPALSPALSPAWAQDAPDWVAPESKLPRPAPGDRGKNLDFLFEALKAAPDGDSAKHVENRIWALLLVSGSDTADLLMSRAKAALAKKDLGLAIRLLDAVVELKPDYVEGWNQRATLHFMKKDYARSLMDLRQVLALEPRHFGALSGLGTILHDIGDDRRALEALRRALAVHPHLPKIPDLVRTLSEQVEGRDI